MKRNKLLLTCLSIAMPSIFMAQHWDLNGNAVNTGEYLGTNNAQNLSIRLNGDFAALFDHNTGNFGVGSFFETEGIAPAHQLSVMSPDENTELSIGRGYNPFDCVYQRRWILRSYNPHTGTVCNSSLSNSRLHFSLESSAPTLSLTNTQVGVRDENPTNDLTIQSFDLPNAGGGLRMKRSGGTLQSRLGIDNKFSNQGLNIEVSPDNGASFSSIFYGHQNLNVGIGTFTPQGRVHILQQREQTNALQLEYDLSSSQQAYYSDITYTDASLVNDINWVIRGIGQGYIGPNDNSEEAGNLHIWSPEASSSASFLGPEEAGDDELFYDDIKVGIGTKKPVSSLHILQKKDRGQTVTLQINPLSKAASRYMDIVFTDPDLGGTQRNWVMRSHGHGTGSGAAGLLQFWSPEESGRVSFESSGTFMHVGIGTSAPTAALHIKQMHNQLQAAKFEFPSSSDATHQYSDLTFLDPSLGGDNRNWIVRAIGHGHSSGNGSLNFISPNVDGKASFLAANGNSVKVSIGTSVTPGDHSLYVKGSIIAEEVYVKLYANWPDFVFAKDYGLMELNTLKDFIETEGHLPNIPSEDEIDAEGGVATGEIIRLQMQKIEELTLYILELNERMEELEKGDL